MDALNHAAQIVTKHLTKRLVYLRRERPTPQPLSELRFDHVERGFDVGPLMIV